MTNVGEGKDYWRESARPLPSLLFIAPMIVVYEIGVLVMGPRAPRNGADVWLRSLLEQVGFPHQFLLPLLTCGLLLAWHYMQQENWRVDWTVVSGMAVESAALGLLLLAVANLLSSSLSTSPLAAIVPMGDLAGRVVGYLGAGIYEELLFRLLLLLPAAKALQAIGLSRAWSMVWAGAATSLLFALAHYQVDLQLLGRTWSWPGEPLDAVTFVFRMLAGCFFSALFVVRGFGIAAGAHALYDIFVALL